MIRREVFGPEASYELRGAQAYREVQPGFRGLRDALASSASGLLLAMAAVGIGFEPGVILLAVPLAALYASWVLTRKVILPFRLPWGARRRDHNHPDPETRRPRMASGVIYLGRDFRTGQQLWIANEDGRQHVAVPGTTGAGKTAALLSLVANALMHGSGFIFVDGKADNKLFAEVLALARRFGREDDVLALNFLVASGNKDTNTFNPLAWGNADGIRELLVSLIEANAKGGSSNGNEVFMSRAVSLLGALMPALVWLRDNKGFAIDVERLRFATELGSIAALALEKRFLRLDIETGQVESIDVPDIEPALLYPLSAYLGETGGYDKSLAHNKQKSDEPAKQHAFVTMHFSAVFTQLGVSLGHIFKCEAGDIDMRDVVLNRRILVVNLPSLENSGETTAALGKIVVASLRNMMAQTLGVNLEGDFDEIVANKPSLAPTPFPVVFDEIGYYAVAGMDKMLAMGPRPGLHVLPRLPGAARPQGPHRRVGVFPAGQRQPADPDEAAGGQRNPAVCRAHRRRERSHAADLVYGHQQRRLPRRSARRGAAGVAGGLEGPARADRGRGHRAIRQPPRPCQAVLRQDRPPGPAAAEPPPRAWPASSRCRRARRGQDRHHPPADRERRAADAEPGGYRTGAGGHPGGLPEGTGGEEVR